MPIIPAFPWWAWFILAIIALIVIDNIFCNLSSALGRICRRCQPSKDKDNA